MEEMESMSDPNPSLESDEQNDFFPSSEFELGPELDGRTHLIDDSGHVSKLVHRFYFVKHWPTDPYSISLIKKKESVIEKMNQDIREMNERMEEKMMLNSLMLHGNKNFAEEKQILRNVNIQERDGASFKSLEMLKETVRCNDYLNNWQKLLREIEQFEIQCQRASGSGNAYVKGKISNSESLRKTIKDEIKVRCNDYLNNWQKLLREIEQFEIQCQRASGSGNAYVKGKISNSESLRKTIKDEIKHLCDDSSENKRKMIAPGIEVMHSEKELEAIDRLINSLETKLTERRQKKGQAYQSISKLKEFHDGEVIHYYQYSSLINKVHQLAKEKDVAALDEFSRSEVRKFMLEWNSNKAFREDYEKKVVQSLERRQLSRDGRRRQDKNST
ncbi:Proton pump-interactor [Glycine max]|nr:Proton pump-interactor [Glycine max]